MVSQMDREEEGEGREGRERRVEKTERRLSGEKVERILESCKKTTSFLTLSFWRQLVIPTCRQRRHR